MPATRGDLEDWFDAGVAAEATHMIVVCDMFDYTDYPLYVAAGDDFCEHYERATSNLQKVMEVYDLPLGKASQLAEHRAFNCPPRLVVAET